MVNKTQYLREKKENSNDLMVASISKYYGIRSKGGPYGYGSIASVYFILLVLFGNCKI